jgi:hypothetical protein
MRGSRAKVWPRPYVYVCGFGGFLFRRPWVPNLGTCASPFKVDKKDTTGQPVEDPMIGLSEDESERLGGHFIPRPQSLAEF